MGWDDRDERRWFYYTILINAGIGFAWIGCEYPDVWLIGTYDRMNDSGSTRFPGDFLGYPP